MFVQCPFGGAEHRPLAGTGRPLRVLRGAPGIYRLWFSGLALWPGRRNPPLPGGQLLQGGPPGGGLSGGAGGEVPPHPHHLSGHAAAKRLPDSAGGGAPAARGHDGSSRDER